MLVDGLLKGDKCGLRFVCWGGERAFCRACRAQGPHGRVSWSPVQAQPPSGISSASARALARKRRRRRVRRLTVVVSSFLAFCLLLVGGVYGYVLYRNGQIHHKHVAGLHYVPPSSPMNILLVGNNSRCALNGQQVAKFGSCSQVGGARSDVTMLLHLNPATRQASVLSLPRDLFLPIPGTNKQNRIDAALNQGPAQLVKTIEDDLGITINHFVELNFDTFQSVVATLGGVNMYFPVPVKDAYSQLNIPTAGCHHLNGFEALALVRARHMYYYKNGYWHYDPMGDLSRIKRDHEFLKVLAATVRKKGLSNLATVNALVGSVLPQLQVDANFSLSDMVHLALTYHSVNPSTIPTATLPIVIDSSFNYYYRGADYGAVVLPIQPLDQQVIDQFLGRSTPPGSSLSPSSITVSVLNGSGVYNQATDTAAQLQALGYHTVGVGNATVVGNPAETVIRYSPGQLKEAQNLASNISGEVSMVPMTTADGADLTLVTGTNFSIASPSSSSTSTSSAPSSSNSGASSQAVSNLASETTAAHTSYPSFDPRGCTASGGPAPLSAGS